MSVIMVVSVSVGLAFGSCGSFLLLLRLALGLLVLDYFNQR